MKRPAKLTDDKIAKALLALVLRTPFTEITPALLAKKTGANIKTISKRFPHYSDMLTFIIAYADKETTRRFKKSESEGPAKDKLFEVVMTRFDWLQENRKSVIAIGKACWDVPELMPVMVNAHWISAQKMLDIINFPTSKSVFSKILLFILYEYVMQLWLSDKSQDMDKTMAGLNQVIYKFLPYC